MSTVAPVRNRPVVITGCQRSGTTLLHLVLDSHPAIRGVDEDEYEDGRLNDYLGAPEYGPVVAFKLPRVSWNAAFMRGLPGVRTIWCVRDPRDVVSSMLRLHLELDGGGPVPWATHPHGAEYELHFAIGALPRAARLANSRRFRRFSRIRRVPPTARSRDDAVFLAALCWRVKNELYLRYGAGLDMIAVHYERLVRQPEQQLRQLLDAIGVEWDPAVLQHHRLHRGTSIGGTDNERAIDAANTGKWRGELTVDELRVVTSLCGRTARRLDYSLDGG